MDRKLKHPDTDVIKEIILKEFQFLESVFNYTHSIKIESNSIFKQSLDVEYNNEGIKRKIIISYTNRHSNNEIRHTFTGSIIRTPYTYIEDYFSLDTYLKSEGKAFPVTILNNLDINDAINILSKISWALKEYVINLVNGKEWYELYYPRKD